MRNSVSCTAERKQAAEKPTAPTPTPTAKATSPSWVKHEVKACGVVAEFPSAPRDETSKVHTARGSAPFNVSLSTLPDDAGEVSVGCGDITKKSISDAALLDNARDGLLKKISATLNEERDVIGGREISFEVEGNQGLARLLLIRDRIIIASVMPVSAFGRKEAKHFLNSVTLVEAP